MAKTVLLTGATGFIGRHTVPRLISSGFEVHAVSSKAQLEMEGVIWHNADLMEGDEAKSLLMCVRPSHLLHFAWYAEPGKFWNSNENFKWVESSIRLIRLFKDYGGNRIVAAGTCAEYSWGGGGVFNEIDSSYSVPTTTYGLAKKVTQQLFEAYSTQNNLSAAWGRIFFLYGPHDHPKKFLPSVIVSMLQKKVIECSHGLQRRDFLHVQDVADAFVALLDSTIEGTINICSGEGYSLKDVASIAARHLDASEYVQFGRSDRDNDPPMIVGGNHRLINELGWVPSVKLEQGIIQTIDWWKNSIIDVNGGT